MNLFDLTGKVAVVTGGNGGIGLGMAEGIASCGANIVIVGRNADKATAALEILRALGVQAAFIAADVTQKAECVKLVAETVAKFGRLDILVNNAGTSIRKMPQDYTEEEWHYVLDTNLTSAFLCSQAAYPAMKQAGSGKMINIGSMMSLFGAPYAAPYASSKGGIVQMSRALATAWAKDNIQVNSVLPGWIDTDLTKRAREQVSELHASVEKRTPAGRWGVPHDMAGIAAFLASPASDFVTGAAIPVDGGFSITT
ncbi:MAG: glucose 1-dehydrogenase [Acetobacteraceae bacterium]|nr:glucose 1-dehydrogenase [Acetobacteraceae bacterium]